VTRTANSLRMHYIAVRADCNIVHPEITCSTHRLQITLSHKIGHFGDVLWIHTNQSRGLVGVLK